MSKEKKQLSRIEKIAEFGVGYKKNLISLVLAFNDAGYLTKTYEDGLHFKLVVYKIIKYNYMKDILKEFEDKYCAFKLCNQVSKPELDKLKDFISKAIDQTREETIREVIEDIQELANNVPPNLLLNQILNKLKK